MILPQFFDESSSQNLSSTAPSLAVQMVDSDEITEEEELLDESEEPISEADGDEFVSESGDDDDDDQMEDADDTTLVPAIISPNFDLEALKIFHHFLSVTSHTLPGPSFDVGVRCYWETAVLPLAFSRQWLMSGVLAISVSRLTD